MVPAISTSSSVACIRSLGKQGIRTIAAAEIERAPSLRSKYCDEAVLVPSPHDDLEGYQQALLALAEQPRVRTIVPIREPDIFILSKHRAEFGNHIATPWVPFDTFQKVRDRRQLLDIAATIGVSVPETRLLDEWNAWNRENVIKSRYSVLAENNRASYADVEFGQVGVEPDFEAVRSRMGHVPLVQEHIPGGTEYGFFAIFDHGEPIATFQHRRVRSYTYSSGASVFRRSISDPQLRENGVALFRELGWHGPAMVEFKRDKRDGELKLMEINPRFWGSLALGIHAGVDFPSR